jgi:hypothetical protein
MYTDAHQRNVMAMMASIQRRLQMGLDNGGERQFLTHTLQYLTTSSGRQVDMEDWMITSYEVEFEHEIGSGGLYVISFYFTCIFYHGCIFLLAGKCSKGAGTRPVWH